MYISEKLHKTNIAEWIIYMWQVEDVIRAYNLDIDRIADEYLTRFDIDDEQLDELTRWYQNLIDMMYAEDCMKTGHLQITRSVLIMMNDLHQQLLSSTKFPFYSSAYYKALPYIVEVRAKGGNPDNNELQSALEMLYGVLLLKMQRREISKETSAAVAEVSNFLGMLSDYYVKDKNNELEF